MKTFARWLLAVGMMFAGLSHLFWARREFQAQVPDLVTDVLPIDKDAVVVASGAVETCWARPSSPFQGSGAASGRSSPPSSSRSSPATSPRPSFSAAQCLCARAPDRARSRGYERRRA